MIPKEDLEMGAFIDYIQVNRNRLFGATAPRGTSNLGPFEFYRCFVAFENTTTTEHDGRFPQSLKSFVRGDELP